MRQATSSKAPMGASEMPSMGAAYQAIPRRSALLLFLFVIPAKAAAGPALSRGDGSGFRDSHVRVLFPDGQAQVALCLPGLRVGSAPVAGTVSRLRQVEHTGSGERGGVEHLRREAQFTG